MAMIQVKLIKNVTLKVHIKLSLVKEFGVLIIAVLIVMHVKLTVIVQTKLIEYIIKLKYID